MLGPLLFLIYINDIVDGLPPGVVELLVGLFADDTKLAVPLEHPQAAAYMQTVLDHLSTWSERWSIPFNIDKCNVMHLGRGNPCFAYKLHNIELKKVDSQRDVGVLVDKGMKFSQHVANQSRRANAVLTQLSKAVYYRNSTFFGLYKTYVLPHLEFASPAWSPMLLGDKRRLEQVQRRATRMVKGLESLPYNERLRRLGFQTLEKRREWADNNQTFAILNALGGLNPSGLFEHPPPRNAITRLAADPLNLRVPHAHKDCRRGFYSIRAAHHWNSLPSNIKLSGNISILKRAQKKLVNHAQNT